MRSFWRDETGAVTLETIIWFPFLFATLAVMSDFYFVQARQSLALNLIQSEVRAFATGALKSCDELTSRVETNLQASMPSATASCEIDDTLLRAAVKIKASDMGMGFVARAMGDYTVAASGVQTFEYIPGV